MCNNHPKTSNEKWSELRFVKLFLVLQGDARAFNWFYLCFELNYSFLNKILKLCIQLDTYLGQPETKFQILPQISEAGVVGIFKDIMIIWKHQ